MKIFGAGLAGLLAGCLFQRAHLFEASEPSKAQHKALLRFRSSAVGDAVGIDFRPVTVRKALWYDGAVVAPTPQLANYYSKKVIGRAIDRSIWNLEPAARWIAPEDFLAQMVERCAGRISWNHPVPAEEFVGPAISTLPMNVAVGLTNEPTPMNIRFRHEPIVVKRWRLAEHEVFQTIYFPSPQTSLYRASVTGDLLIAEYAGASDDYDFFAAFGLDPSEALPIEKVSQRYGKIAPLEDDAWRKAFIFNLTSQRAIFSLGRFATWRNILMDDVLKDIGVLKKLMNSSAYDRQRHSAVASVEK